MEEISTVELLRRIEKLEKEVLGLRYDADLFRETQWVMYGRDHPAIVNPFEITSSTERSKRHKGSLR